MLEALLFCGSLWNADMCEVGLIETDDCEQLCLDAQYDDDKGLAVSLTVRI